METNIEIFIAVMDGLFWDGYAQQLSKDNPAQFTFELSNFFNNYGHA